MASDISDRSREYYVKCGLVRLGASPQTRSWLDRWLEAAQVLAVRGTLLANHTVATCLEVDGRPVPDVADQTFWHRCVTCCGKLEGRVKAPCADPEIQRSYEELLSLHRFDPVVTDYMWPVVATIARSFMTSSMTMLKTQLHPEIKRHVRRVSTLWEHSGGAKLESKLVPKLVRHVLKRTFGSALVGRGGAFPDGCPEPLLASLEALADSWRLRYPHGTSAQQGLRSSREQKPSTPPEGEIPMEESCDGSYARDLLLWRRELQVARASHVVEMTALLGTGRERDALRAFRKNARAGLLLPLAACSMRHIALDYTTLKSLVAGIRSKDPSQTSESRKRKATLSEDPVGENDATREGGVRKRISKSSAAMANPAPTLTATKPTQEDASGTSKSMPRKRRKLTQEELSERIEDKSSLFDVAFPGLAHLLGAKRGLFRGHISTDGVACSLLLERATVERRKARKYVPGARPKPEGRDLEAARPPVLPDPRRHTLVGIDPGRRDKRALLARPQGADRCRGALLWRDPQVFHQAAPAGVWQERSQGRHPQGLCPIPRRRGASLGLLAEVSGQGLRPLWLEEAPAARASVPGRVDGGLQEQGHSSSSLSGPHAEGSILGWRLPPSLCHGKRRLPQAAPHRLRRRLDRFDRFRLRPGAAGAAEAASEARAPKAHRLRTMHKALVTVIHEFRTSVMCHRCHGLLEKCFHRGAARTTARPIHGIMSCPRCLNRSGARQFWHRDVNAARNIFAIYLSLAVSGQRPSYLRRAE